MSILTRKITPIHLALLVAIFALLVWSLFFPHRYESGGPLTLENARSHSPIDLPASATHIRIATLTHFQQHLEYIRFEAPVADCEAHAKKLLPGETALAFASEPGSVSRPISRSFKYDLSWFDLSGVSRGLMIGKGGPDQPLIYIDLDRGIFYYVRTD